MIEAISAQVEEVARALVDRQEPATLREEGTMRELHVPSIPTLSDAQSAIAGFLANSENRVELIFGPWPIQGL